MSDIFKHQRDNKTAQEELAAEERKKDRQVKYSRMFGGDDGKYILDDLSDFAGLNTISFRTNGTTEQAIFTDGMKAVVYYILHQAGLKLVPVREEK